MRRQGFNSTYKWTKCMLIAVAATSIRLQRVRTEAPKGTAAAAVNNVCGEIVYLQQLKTKFTGQISGALSHADKLAKDAAKLSLAAQQALGGPKALGYTILATIAEKRARTATKAVNERYDAVQKLIDKLATREGQLKAARRIHKQGSVEKTRAEGGADGDNTFGVSTYKCTITTAEATEDYGACKTLESNPGAISKAFEELTTEENLKTIKDGYFARRQMTLIALTKGTESSATTETAAKNCAESGGDDNSKSNAIGATLRIAADSMENPEETGLYANKENKHCEAENPDKTMDIVTGKGLAYQICKTGAKEVPKTPSVFDSTVTSLSQDPDVQAIVTQLNDKGKASEIKPANQAETLKALKTIYGTGATDLEDKYITPINNHEIVYKAGGDDAKKSISAIVDAGETPTAIAYFYAELAKKSLNKEPVKTDSKPESRKEQDEEKCKDKPQGECKDEDGCVFKGGKCVAKATTATGTDGKPTNTTGSNSFVINKAPLLLAVLLF
uniref:Variant surface glycoprotein 25 n=1 Tax=Trypanosoma brucei TaxID=5691 RepID=M4SZS6_9TRYP|nr:variant surface glycoprotein 25 [Trypanosoma brucei]